MTSRVRIPCGKFIIFIPYLSHLRLSPTRITVWQIGAKYAACHRPKGRGPGISHQTHTYRVATSGAHAAEGKEYTILGYI